MVIAILAILALIAIPRFAGFTDKAKIQADDQYASLVGNSVMVLLAAGDINLETATTEATVTVSGKPAAITGVTDIYPKGGTAGTDITPAALNDLVKKLTANKDLQYYTSMTIRIDADGVVSKVGTN